MSRNRNLELWLAVLVGLCILVLVVVSLLGSTAAERVECAPTEETRTGKRMDTYYRMGNVLVPIEGSEYTQTKHLCEDGSVRWR